MGPLYNRKSIEIMSTVLITSRKTGSWIDINRHLGLDHVCGDSDTPNNFISSDPVTAANESLPVFIIIPTVLLTTTKRFRKWNRFIAITAQFYADLYVLHGEP